MNRSTQLALAGVAVVTMMLQTGQAENPPATRPQDRPMPQTKGPITYYVQNCSRCHGDISAAYVGIKHPKHGNALRNIIDDMATGPANAPLDAAGLDEQTKLHEAMFADKPYAWIDRTQNPPVVEKLDNTEVKLVWGDVVDVPARTDGYRAEFYQSEGRLIVTHVQTKPSK